MGKLRVYPTYSEGLKTVHVSVPTSQEYQKMGVFEDLTNAIESIGYVRIEGESKKSSARFIGTTLDVIKVTFRTIADLMRFKAYIQSNYES